MTASDVREIFLSRFGVRLEPEMCSYVLRRLKSGQPLAATAETLPVMGGNARTGLPVRFAAPLGALGDVSGGDDTVA